MDKPRTNKILDGLRDVVHAQLDVPLDDRATVAEIVGCLVCVALEVYDANKEDDD